MIKRSDIDLIQLGERLRVARSQSRLTQEAAAVDAGISRTTLVAIERGQRRPRPEELRSFAQIYRVSMNELLNPTSVHVDLAARFRCVDAQDNSIGEALRLLSKLAAAAVSLEQLVGMPLSYQYPPEQPISPGNILEQAEEAALSLRHRLGLGLSPILDLVSLIEMELGIRVFIRPLPSRISGLFAYEPTVGACILINANHPRERRAVTISHELGHFISARNTADVVEIEELHNSVEERFARAFSFAFLMPAPAIRRQFREITLSEERFSPRHLILMAHGFHVSTEAICRRLEGLKLLPSGTFDSLRERGFSNKLVRQVIGDPAPEVHTIVSPRLSFLAAEAYQRGLVTEGQLCEKLQMDRIEVRQLLDEMDAEGLDSV